MRRPILNHTRPDEVVYDPLLGSGSRLIACRALADWSAELRLLKGLATVAHPLGHVRAENAGSTPRFAQARRIRHETGSNVTHYRERNGTNDNTPPDRLEVATGAPQFAHVRAERGTWQCRTTAGNWPPKQECPQRPKPSGRGGVRAATLPVDAVGTLARRVFVAR